MGYENFRKGIIGLLVGCTGIGLLLLWLRKQANDGELNMTKALMSYRGDRGLFLRDAFLKAEAIITVQYSLRELADDLSELDFVKKMFPSGFWFHMSTDFMIEEYQVKEGEVGVWFLRVLLILVD